MPKKIRELKKMLKKAGFTSIQGRGSHEKWVHELLAEHVVVAGKDGSDAKTYLEKQVERLIKEVEQRENDA